MTSSMAVAFKDMVTSGTRPKGDIKALVDTIGDVVEVAPLGGAGVVDEHVEAPAALEREAHRGDVGAAAVDNG